MGIVKRSKDSGGALGAFRRQKDIADKIKRGEAISADSAGREALVLLLDMSPSMGMHQDAGTMKPGDRLRYGAPRGHRAWDAAVRATEALVDASVMSRIGVVAFDSKAPLDRRLPIGANTAKDRLSLVAWLARRDPRHGRGTDFTSAINGGLDLLESHRATEVRRMILMTDGRDGRHAGKENAQIAEERLRASGVVLDTVGFGNVDHDELRRLVALTGGVYHHSTDGASLVKTFKQLEVRIRGLLGKGE